MRTVFLIEVARPFVLNGRSYNAGDKFKLTHEVIPPNENIDYECCGSIFEEVGGFRASTAVDLFDRYLPTILPHAPPPEVIDGITTYDLGLVPLG